MANISHDEKLAEQTPKQCRQQHQLKQSELKSQIDALQQLTNERAAVLPIANATADSYEQTISQNLQTAQSAQQQAADTVKQAETELASHIQHQQHWQTETIRRYGNLEKAQNTLNEALAKQAITLAQLSDLLAKDELWLAEQKTAMTALERGLQESSALLKVKAEDCLKRQNQAVDTSEAAASQLLLELQQQRQTVHSQKEKQVILLCEDDKKIAAGQR